MEKVLCYRARIIRKFYVTKLSAKHVEKIFKLKDNELKIYGKKNINTLKNKLYERVCHEKIFKLVILSETKPKLILVCYKLQIFSYSLNL